MIREAYDAQQYQHVSELAHKIKGASRSLSIESVGSEAEKLELGLKDGKLSADIDYDELMSRLEQALSKTMHELAYFLEQDFNM